MRIHGLQKLTLLDYPEHVACTVFTAGCNLRCPFCHNAILVTDILDTDAIPEEEFFSDTEVTLSRVSAGHREETLACGTLRQTEDALALGDFRFPLAEVHDMAEILSSRLLFTCRDEYYQLRADNANLRKYLEFWKSK